MSKVLITGSQGFIGGYIVEELLRRGHTVVGVDNLSKYGRVAKSYDHNPAYTFVEGDARDVDLLTELLTGCDQFIAGAAMIGGISYFHTYAYDLLATNERIMAASCDAAIAAHRDGRLQKVTYISSSMVFESATSWPSAEGSEREIPPPLSSYGFQKLAVEYYARAAWDQYQLPYTIVRPFNCVGIGEGRALGDVEILSGNVKLAMSHVVPDLVQKVLKGQDPLHILGSGEHAGGSAPGRARGPRGHGLLGRQLHRGQGRDRDPAAGRIHVPALLHRVGDPAHPVALARGRDPPAMGRCRSDPAPRCHRVRVLSEPLAGRPSDHPGG